MVYSNTSHSRLLSDILRLAGLLRCLLRLLLLHLLLALPASRLEGIGASQVPRGGTDDGKSI